jgi:hypothetical protein
MSSLLHKVMTTFTTTLLFPEQTILVGKKTWTQGGSLMYVQYPIVSMLH